MTRWHDSYDDWHVLTVEPDGEDDGEPLFIDTWEHPPGCPKVEFRTIQGDDLYCWTADTFGEYAGFGRADYGLPMTAGQYRVRAWGDEPSAPLYEADGGLECEPLTEPAERMGHEPR